MGTTVSPVSHAAVRTTLGDKQNTEPSGHSSQNSQRVSAARGEAGEQGREAEEGKGQTAEPQGKILGAFSSLSKFMSAQISEVENCLPESISILELKGI